MVRLLGKLLRAEKGATAIEYGLIIALIVIAAVSGFSVLGNSSNGRWGSVSNKISAVEP